jgi:hypothetical protein
MQIDSREYLERFVSRDEQGDVISVLFDEFYGKNRRESQAEGYFIDFLVDDFDIIKHYGLSFGEIDFIRNKNGDYVFLEINPNGQWLWLELKSGYNLTKDVADNLL